MTNWKRLKISRELSVESFIIDRETQNTKDYKRLNKALFKSGLMRSTERVIAMEAIEQGEQCTLSVIIA
jgi:hypothetical protein